MQKVLTAEQMRGIDRLTSERHGISSILLMENAANAVVRAISDYYEGVLSGKSVLIFCGRGNNGGDGAAAARILTLAGAETEILLFGARSAMRGDARINLDAAEAIVGHITAIQSQEEFAAWRDRAPRNRDCVVDALFGTGLDREIDKWLAEAMKDLQALKTSNGLAVSVDIPSGLRADSGEKFGTAFEADLTVTFTAPKPACVLPPAANCIGELIVADIGSPPALIDEQPSNLYVANRSDVAKWLARSAFTDASYKNKRGHALIIGGSKNYSGAAVLCGDAAIRSGCGLVTLAVPETSRESVAGRVQPEVMVRGIAETPAGSAAEKAAEEIDAFLTNVDVVAVGSGLSSKEDETQRFVKRFVDERKTPIVIDADGLTALSPFDEFFRGVNIAGKPPIVVTPHEGEFGKMLGIEKAELESQLRDRPAAVRDFATKHGVFLVLKGQRVLIGDPEGRVVISPTGNSGLGKAGNGDTLAGMLTGFLAQGEQMEIPVLETVTAAVYVAGLAGDLADKKFGKRVMTASDVRESLAEVFASFEDE